MGFSISNLCTPAYFYLVISAIALTLMAFQNFGNSKVYCLGDYSCEVANTGIIFAVKIIVVLFWTYVLNLICKAGAPGVSWFLVLIPFILAFIMLGIFYLSIA
jgi:hypothetical protein